jgi:tyrosinase
MQSHALEIAKKYIVDTETWITAAQNLRAPYWDWATPGNIVPPAEVISLESVDITTFDGSTIPWPNPLYKYTFNPIDDSFKLSSWSHNETTLRNPTSDGPDATTDVEGLKKYDLTLPLTHSRSRFSPKGF